MIFDERLLSGVLLFGLMGMLTSGCGGPATEAAGGGGGRPPAPVRVAYVVRQTIEPQVVVVGNVVARRTSVVASGAEGKVDDFLVREGETVEAGQILSTLSMVTTDLGIVEAEQVLAERQHEFDKLSEGSRVEEEAEARARMDGAARRLERAERLAEQGAANQDDLDEARELFDVAEAQWQLVDAGPRAEEIASARARRDAQQAQVEYLEAEKDKRTTTAPFAGVVVEEMTEVGQWLSKGDSVVTVSDLLEEVHVVANVDQSELSNVQIDHHVEVEIEGEVWDGRVISVVPRSEWQSGSRAFPVKVSVPNRTVTGDDGTVVPVLTEGMIARVTFVGPSREAVLVPKDSIIRSESGSRLFTVIPGEDAAAGKAQPVTIREGPSFGAFVELPDEELQPGVQVVVEGAERLQPYADILIQAVVDEDETVEEIVESSTPGESDAPETD